MSLEKEVPMSKLRKRSLFRVVYHTRKGDPSSFNVGSRKTVVADKLQQAIDAVKAHEAKVCPDIDVVITEVVREGIEVWSH
jgi:hypothetical protein